jgi:hypothetical protein
MKSSEFTVATIDWPVFSSTTSMLPMVTTKRSRAPLTPPTQWSREGEAPSLVGGASLGQ